MVALSTASTSLFCPRAVSRSFKFTPASRSKSPSRSNSKRGPKVSKPQTKAYEPPLRPVPGGAATSYTCLPPLQDVSFNQHSLLPSSGQEVKLVESLVSVNPKSSKVLKYKFVDEEVVEEGDNDVEDDYGRFELFEVGSDAEDVSDDEDDWEDEEEIEEDEPLGRVNYTVGEVFEPGQPNDFKFEDMEDDSDYDEFEDDDDVANYRVGEVFEPRRRAAAEEQEDTEPNEKGKGVPAVMRCFDKAKIYVKAGDGGNGVVAFRREKFVPLGGPSGGNGGRGGNVYLEVDGAMNSLLPFRNKVHFRAGRGSHGQGALMDGAKGEDVVIKVAPGTLIREAGKEKILLELMEPGQRALLLPGGRGGRGNAAFKCSGNKAPRIAENGEEGPEMWLELELKLVADVGIVGAPNAGKSTLLSVISAAKPEIANYPFTTLLPNLGVVSFDYDCTIIVADLPGLLEGAHRGFGLGHEFLRHSERCSALVHVVDGSSQQPDLEFDAVRLEIELFSPELAEKPYVVAFNKMDLPEARENWPSFRQSLQARGITTFCISAVKRENTFDLICAANELLKTSKTNNEGNDGWSDPVDLNHVADMVQKQRRAPINDFEISHDHGSKTWYVSGSGLQRFIQMTNWRYVDSDRRFQHVLDACGVNKSLIKMGVKEGDTVNIGEMELIWHDSPESSGPAPIRHRSFDSAKWPELK